MQRFTGVHLQPETGCQNIGSPPPFIDEFLLRLGDAGVCRARVPVIRVLPLCLSSVFTSEDIIGNGRPGQKTSAASFSVRSRVGARSPTSSSDL